jgi:hypothetical protein
VRSTIFDSLQARTNSKSKIYCQICSKLASFQLAVCYKLGFGVARDERMSQIHLEISSRRQEDLENELLFLRQRQLDSTYTKSNFRSLLDQGHISSEKLPERYREQGELARAESAYTREIADMQSVLGETHGVVLLLKSTLVSLLREGGKLQESERLGIQAMEAFQRSFGNEHPDTIISMENLAQTWTQQRLWNKVCEIEEHIMALRASEQGPNHASTLTAAANLATTYRVLASCAGVQVCIWRDPPSDSRSYGSPSPDSVDQGTTSRVAHHSGEGSGNETQSPGRSTPVDVAGEGQSRPYLPDAGEMDRGRGDIFGGLEIPAQQSREPA